MTYLKKATIMKHLLPIVITMLLAAFSASARDCHDRRPPRSPYFVADNKVFFEGHGIEGASASSFEILRDGYAKDAWSVYFCGEKIADASSSSFRTLGYGYAKDSWKVYYNGVGLDGASPDSFKVLKHGYAKDTWSTYYYGRKID